MKPLWKQRNFMLLWGGQTASWLGTEISGIALPLVVLALTGSPAKAGIVAAIRGASYVIWAIPAGLAVDRWNRRLVMVASNLGSGIAMGAISLGLFWHNLTITELYILCAVEGSCFVFANLGRLASFTKVVPKEQLVAAQSIPANQMAVLVGPPLGGFLYETIGGFATFFADALSYFINAFSIFFITIPLGSKTSAERKAFHHEIKEAVSWYRQQPVIRFLNLITAGRIGIIAGLYLLIIVLAKQDHASSTAIGLIFAIGAIGEIIGSVVSSKLHSRFSLKHLLIAINLLSFLFLLSYFFAVNIFLLALITALFYLVDPLHNVVTSTYSASITPDNIRGRVISLTRIQVLAANSAGFFVAGIALQYFGSSLTIGLFSGFLLILFLAVVTNKRLAKI